MKIDRNSSFYKTESAVIENFVMWLSTNGHYKIENGIVKPNPSLVRFMGILDEITTTPQASQSRPLRALRLESEFLKMARPLKPKVDVEQNYLNTIMNQSPWFKNQRIFVASDFTLDRNDVLAVQGLNEYMRPLFARKSIQVGAALIVIGMLKVVIDKTQKPEGFKASVKNIPSAPSVEQQ